MDVFVAGKTERDHGGINYAVDGLIESSEIQDKHEKWKELEKFLYQTCNTYGVEEVFKALMFHQQAGVIRYSQEREKFIKLNHSQSRADPEYVSCSYFEKGFGLETILEVEIGHPEDGRGENACTYYPKGHWSSAQHCSIDIELFVF